MQTKERTHATRSQSLDALSGLADLLRVREVRYEQRCGKEQAAHHGADQETDHAGVAFQTTPS